jgi:hypothetical protein
METTSNGSFQFSVFSISEKRVRCKSVDEGKGRPRPDAARTPLLLIGQQK